MSSNQAGRLDKRELAETNLLFNGESRKFFYRANSKGDKGAIHQVLVCKDYDLRKFAHMTSLRRFSQEQEKQGKRNLVLDLGANIGAASVWFHADNPGARIVAVEPEPNNYQLLSLNCNELDVISLQAAVGSHNGTAFLHDPGLGDWGFSVGTDGKVPVSVVSVPNLLAQYTTDVFAPYICKIDIEGSEAVLFQQDYSWMDLFPVIIIELHDWLYPGKALSRNFLRAVSEHDFDFVFRGENVFCFNNRLLLRHVSG